MKFTNNFLPYGNRLFTVNNNYKIDVMNNAQR